MDIFFHYGGSIAKDFGFEKPSEIAGMDYKRPP
jgi:hypothetical protein